MMALWAYSIEIRADGLSEQREWPHLTAAKGSVLPDKTTKAPCTGQSSIAERCCSQNLLQTDLQELSDEETHRRISAALADAGRTIHHAEIVAWAQC